MPLCPSVLLSLYIYLFVFLSMSISVALRLSLPICLSVSLCQGKMFYVFSLCLSRSPLFHSVSTSILKSVSLCSPFSLTLYISLFLNLPFYSSFPDSFASFFTFFYTIPICLFYTHVKKQNIVFGKSVFEKKNCQSCQDLSYVHFFLFSLCLHKSL